MRIFLLLFSAACTALLIILFHTTAVLPAPLGKLLSPQHGVWQNAEPTDYDYNTDIKLVGLKGKSSVYLDERLVPHVFAEQDEDAYFVQGYLHAKFRLWQMEFQTHAAAGRLSEILGDKLNGNDILNKADRQFRRLGMVYAAEKAVVEMEKDPATKMSSDAYTRGVNAYIQTLSDRSMPLEYKILGYQPEPWTNLKTALFLKYMSYDLASYERDFENTNAKSVFSLEDVNLLFPNTQDSLDPIIPLPFPDSIAPLALTIPATADSLYFQKKDSMEIASPKPDKDNGSNNWAVAGTKTKSGAPILCNDPHLGLNLPSLWYEMQIHTPNFNAYGATFPGAPSVIIGFNDSCAFGFTNAGRDVRDYYEIKFKDEQRSAYWFNNQWVPTEFRYEVIKIKGKPDFIDTVAYTFFGPVMYDQHYDGNRTGGKGAYAVRWKAHDAGNELKIFNNLNYAKNYADYAEAIKNLRTPGQNCLFAAKNGDIALWCQGEFPAKWKGQGDYIMPGTDSSYLWQGMIPQAQNPHQVNPERGFVSSANQLPVNPKDYPYYLGGSFPLYRGIIVNRLLNEMQQITPQDMMNMQNENYNVFAEYARPIILKYLDVQALDGEEKSYYDMLQAWNLRNDPKEPGATVFNLVWDSLEQVIFADEYAQTKLPLLWPDESTLLENLIRDSSFHFCDDIRTTQREGIAENILVAFRKAVPALKKAAAENRLAWAAFKDTRVNHLTRIPALSRLHLPIGGGTHIINATKEAHGPSWKMVVHLTAETEAYGIYPGGQQGNPGSKYYDQFVDDWAMGKYYRLWMMKETEKSDPRVRWTMTFQPA
jgi:penicillin G amidase